MVQSLLAKILLYPFSLLYGFIIGARNLAYDSGLLKATKFNLPVISIGNLSIGGAGKTPHVEFMIRQLLPYLNIASLSRGYKRTTKGFRMVEKFDDALIAGDEPIMYKRKYQNLVVAVSESRALAIPLMIKKHPELQVILLDDAFQHRGIIPGLNILLTTYDHPFSSDLLLPSGRLREYKSSYERADIIIVTKCNSSLTLQERNEMIEEIKPFPHQKLFFSEYKYLKPYSFYNHHDKLDFTEDMDVILISAIANSSYLIKYLDPKVASIHQLEYEDHHVFSERDITYLNQVFTNRDTQKKIILTTEKDAVRLDVLRDLITRFQLPIYILPVEVNFLFDEEEDFLSLTKSFLMNFKA